MSVTGCPPGSISELTFVTVEGAKVLVWYSVNASVNVSVTSCRRDQPRLCVNLTRLMHTSVTVEGARVLVECSVSTVVQVSAAPVSNAWLEKLS
jgi:hypothetical protein